jgi:hypothetical protein
MVRLSIPLDIVGPPMERVATLRLSLADVARRLGVHLGYLAGAASTGHPCLVPLIFYSKGKADGGGHIPDCF